MDGGWWMVFVLSTSHHPLSTTRSFSSRLSISRAAAWGGERVRVRSICGLRPILDNGGKVYILDRKSIDRCSIVATDVCLLIPVELFMIA